ncbi:MAG: hypothetical protein Q4C58_05875 [Eubacteriales bacterium]|nr:hypothetical protein [Eubacteriales bacterium]
MGKRSFRAGHGEPFETFSIFGVSVKEWTQDESNQKEKEAENKTVAEKKGGSGKLIHFLAAMMAGILFVMILSFAAVRTDDSSGTVPQETSALTEAQTDISTETETEKEAISQEGTMAQPDYLNSPDGVALQQTAQDFAKAYFQADKELAGEYAVIGEENLEVWEKDVWDDLDHFVLKWNPQDLKENSPVHVQYEFRIAGDDSYTYLGLELMKIQENWKVTDAYPEK